MHFDFFTLGGSFFWEDVFFYQKWRIQRHCITKRYRLLDSWDIRRASGSFEACKKAFVEYIKSYEITRQQGNIIILLHGFGDSKNIFKPLWRKLILTNSTIAALNYPSLFRSSLASAYQLLFFLNHIDDIDEVSFVTKGAGNLVLQHALNQPMEMQSFRDRIRIKNVVEINPVIKESLLSEILGKFKLFRFLLGPMLQDFSEKSVKQIPGIPSDVNFLSIFSDSKLFRAYICILKFLHIPVEDLPHKKKQSIYLEGTTFFTLRNEKVLNYTVNFINNGKI